MIRALTQDGQLKTFGAWSEAAAWLAGAAGVLDIEIAFPESTGLDAEGLARVAGALAPLGLVRVQWGWPGAVPAADGARRQSPSSRRIVEAAESAGLQFVASRPKHLQEFEFLSRDLGYAEAWAGLDRTDHITFGEMVFRRPDAGGADRRPRLGMITFDLYFRHLYESPALDALLNIRKAECKPFASPAYYADLIAFKPDVLLVFRPDYLRPETFRAFDCPVVGFATEPLPRFVDGRIVASEYNAKVYDLLKKVRGLCDNLYHYDAACVDFLRREDFPVSGLFPPCVCTDIYRPDPALAPRWDAVFIGKSTEYRERYLSSLHLVCRFFHAAHGLMGAEELLPFLQRSKIGLNIHRDETPNIEPRLFLLMAAGLFVLTHALPANPWLQEGLHYVAFQSKTDLAEKVTHYLGHDDVRRRIAENGRRWVCENASATVVLPRLVKRVLGHERQR